MQIRWFSALLSAVCLSSSVVMTVASPAKADPGVIAFDDNAITFRHGIAADGNSHVRLYPDGRVEFKSHFHDSGSADYWYSITWAVRASDGTVFTLHHRAKIIGHVFGGGQADRNSDFDQTITNPAVAQHWAALTRASTARIATHAATTLSGYVDDVKEAVDDVKDAVQTAQGVYDTVTTVIALF